MCSSYPYIICNTLTYYSNPSTTNYLRFVYVLLLSVIEQNTNIFKNVEHEQYWVDVLINLFLLISFEVLYCFILTISIKYHQVFILLNVNLVKNVF